MSRNTIREQSQHFIATAAFSAVMASQSLAQEIITVPFDGSFDDATFAVESAIVGQGLVIDYVSHVGEMLNRTGADVGSDKQIFKAADIFIFCSATVSREVMEADPMNIGFALTVFSWPRTIAASKLVIEAIQMVRWRKSKPCSRVLSKKPSGTDMDYQQYFRDQLEYCRRKGTSESLPIWCDSAERSRKPATTRRLVPGK